jgi:hypothetical protein
MLVRRVLAGGIDGSSAAGPGEAAVGGAEDVGAGWAVGLLTTHPADKARSTRVPIRALLLTTKRLTPNIPIPAFDEIAPTPWRPSPNVSARLGSALPLRVAYGGVDGRSVLSVMRRTEAEQRVRVVRVW